MSHEGFLQAILEEPDDDVHRLVYADWLEEHDDPRGPFIRTQIEAASLPEDEPRRDALEAQARDLLRRYQDEWDRPLLDAAGYDPRSSGWMGMIGKVARFFRASWPKPPLYLREYHRGFVDVVHFDMSKFVERAEALFRVAPIQEVYFELVSSRMTDLAALPQLQRVRGLHLIYTFLREDALIELLASPHLTGLRTLDMPGNHLSEHSVRLLAASTAAKGLTTLNVANTDMNDAAVEALADSPALSGLTHLYLGSNPFGFWAVQALAKSPYMNQLVSLHLDGINSFPLGDPIPSQPLGLTNLRELNLRNTDIGEGGLTLLRKRFPNVNIMV
jgi:uncharacterized protein (TIGR02996 family)